MHRKSIPALLFALVLSLIVECGGGCGTEQVCYGDDCVHSAGYWIVSTYGMDQHPGSCPGRICFQVYQKTCDGKLRKSSITHMQQCLNPQAPTCVFVHGSFVDIDSALTSSHETYRWLKQGAPCCELNTIFFVWPSSDAETVLLPTKVVENGLKAAHNGMYLSTLIDYLPPCSPLCLMGHSHGARVVAASLHYRAGGVIQGCAPRNRANDCRRIRVVLAAAAINHDWLNPDDRYGLALTQVDGLLNMVNHRDLALTLYPLVSLPYGRALAKSGVTFFDAHKLGPLACKIQELNVSREVGVRHVWSSYYSRPEISRMISGYVYGNCLPAGPSGLVDARLDAMDRELAEWTGQLQPGSRFDIELPLPQDDKVADVTPPLLPALPAIPAFPTE